jgi:hypothetical protein
MSRTTGKAMSQVSETVLIERFKIVTMRDEAQGGASVQIGISSEHFEISLGGQSFRTTLQKGIAFIDAAHELYATAAPMVPVVGLGVGAPEEQGHAVPESPAIPKLEVPDGPVTLSETACIPTERTCSFEPVVPSETAMIGPDNVYPIVLNDAVSVTVDETMVGGQKHIDPSQDMALQNVVDVAVQVAPEPKIARDETDGLSDFLARTSEIPETTVPAGMSATSYAPRPLGRRRFEGQQNLPLLPPGSTNIADSPSGSDSVSLQPVRLRRANSKRMLPARRPLAAAK